MAMINKTNHSTYVSIMAFSTLSALSALNLSSVVNANSTYHLDVNNLVAQASPNFAQRPEYTSTQKLAEAQNDYYSGFGFFSSDSSASDTATSNHEEVAVDTSSYIDIGQSFGERNDMDKANSASTNSLVSTREHKTKFSKNDPYYGKELCGNGEYSCIKLKKKDSWKTLFPDDYERELVQRINRTNTGLWNRSWILVPNDLNKDYLSYSPLPQKRSDITAKTVIVDQKELAFGAYNEKGELVHWGPVNPGKSGTRTSLGDNFKVYRKGGAGCWSKKFDANMPYCIFFNGGFAMHGFNMPGYPASHGCVRMNNSDAKWLNKEFTDYSTRVVVTSLK